MAPPVPALCSLLVVAPMGAVPGGVADEPLTFDRAMSCDRGTPCGVAGSPVTVLLRGVAPSAPGCRVVAPSLPPVPVAACAGSIAACGGLRGPPAGPPAASSGVRVLCAGPPLP